MQRGKCGHGTCKNFANYFVSQPTIPQRLATGDMETSPAARSILSCGVHLSSIVNELGNLPFRTNESLKVTIQRGV